MLLKVGCKKLKAGKLVGRSAKVLPSCQSFSKSVRHLRTRTLQTLKLSIDRKTLIMRMVFNISPQIGRCRRATLVLHFQRIKVQSPAHWGLGLLLEARGENASQWNRFTSTCFQGRDLPSASLWVWGNWRSLLWDQNQIR